MASPFEGKDHVRHSAADTDLSWDTAHHTLGKGATQAAPGNHQHTEYADKKDLDLYLKIEDIPPGGGAPTDHGSLVGLGDDDHPQYLTNARGDARYVNVTGGDAMQSNLTVQGITADAWVNTDVLPGKQGGLFFYSNGLPRWAFYKSSHPEAGNSAGSDLYINRYNDGGTSLGFALSITRLSGKVYVPNLEANGESKWADAVMTNGWTTSKMVYRNHLGVVYIQGTIVGGTVGSSVAAFTLPSAFRPTVFGQELMVPCSGGYARISILTSGAVCVTQIFQGTNSWVNISASFALD